ncbi:cytochrome C assembly family protein [Ornithinibacillus bavariensis]|uniref:cytochrome C assembly family protein n=1 Tax=Ornithinibacillus bavariensis TaxID=545502 RepID=UPI001BB4134C|nr:cytochrome c biogenesis protein CcsA [Ornithinibacillus bavariensis]
MVDLRWLYEGIVSLYVLSLIGYFIDFVQQNRRANTLAFWLLCMVWLLQTFFLFHRVLTEGRFPIATLTDSFFFYAWILVTFSILMNWLFKISFIVFFINLFSFLIFLMHISHIAQTNMVTSGIQLVNEILIAHISLAIISYGFFTIAFLLSIMYMVQYYFLKEKKAIKWIWRLGDLERLELMTFRTITIGVPTLLIGIILGFVWAYTENATFYWYDLKTIGSLVVLSVYISYLCLRTVKRYSGKALATYNTWAFLFLLLNFFIFSHYSSFHLL